VVRFVLARAAGRLSEKWRARGRPRVGRSDRTARRADWATPVGVDWPDLIQDRGWG
jgi:hypothetical protein